MGGGYLKKQIGINDRTREVGRARLSSDSYFKVWCVKAVQKENGELKAQLRGFEKELEDLKAMVNHSGIANGREQEHGVMDINKPNPIICKFVRRLAKDKVMSMRREANNVTAPDLDLTNATIADIELLINILKTVKNSYPSTASINY